MRADGDLERDVKDELRWQPGLDATDVAVSVKDEGRWVPYRLLGAHTRKRGSRRWRIAGQFFLVTVAA